MTINQFGRMLLLLVTAPLWLPVALLVVLFAKVAIRPDGAQRFA